MKPAGVFVRGLAMGAADVVPGVSGGTVALITGIYERLIKSLSAFNLDACRYLLKGQVSEAWRHIDGNFLLALFAGVATSLFSLAKIISSALEQHPHEVYSFFMGLILASSMLLARDIRPWRAGSWMALIMGVLLMLLVSELRPATPDVGPLLLFGAGAIAICAMILPGISGSFLLLIMGVYPVVLGAIESLDFATLAVFALGCAVGLLSFVRLLSWLLLHCRLILMTFLVGVLLGSLKVLWPWQSEQVLVLPVWQESAMAAAMFVFGLGLVLALARLGEGQRQSD